MMERLPADVWVGEEIPAFELPLSVQRLVMEAGVNRDFAPIHHDVAAASHHGAPDIFANNLLLQSIFEATIRQWMGLRGRLVSLQFRIETFNCAGQVLVCRGRVMDIKDAAVTLEIQIESGDRVTTRGTATVVLAPNTQLASPCNTPV